MKVAWQEMFPDELLEAIRERKLCLMPYGLAEPHGAYTVPTQDLVSEWWVRFHQQTYKYWFASRNWHEYKSKTFLSFPGWEALGLGDDADDNQHGSTP